MSVCMENEEYISEWHVVAGAPYSRIYLSDGCSYYQPLSLTELARWSEKIYRRAMYFF